MTDVFENVAEYTGTGYDAGAGRIAGAAQGRTK